MGVLVVRSVGLGEDFVVVLVVKGVCVVGFLLVVSGVVV